MAHKLTQRFKFAPRTTPELYEAVHGYVLQVASSGVVKFRGRKLGVEAAINAVLIWFLEQPEAKRKAILVDYVPRFEVMLKSTPGTQASMPWLNLVNNTQVPPPAPASKKSGRRAAGSG